MSMFDDRQGNRDMMTVAVFGIGFLAFLAIAGILAGGWVAMYKRPDHVFDAIGVGGAIASVLGGMATFATAYAWYWKQDGQNALAVAQAKAIS